MVLKRNIVLLLADGVLVGAGYLSASVLRFAFDVPDEYMRVFWLTVPVVVSLKLLVFFFFHLYRVIWRHIGMIDLFNIVKANIVCSVLLIAGLMITRMPLRDAGAIVVVDGLLCLLLVASVRIGIRLVMSSLEKQRGFKAGQGSSLKTRKIVIIGAGEVGEKIFREIRDNGRLRYDVVGFLDDDAKKVGLSIHGKKVLGGVEKLGEVVGCVALDEVIIAIGAVSGRQMRRFVQICERYGLSCRTIPVVGDILNGQVSVNRLKPVSYENLLGRLPVIMDTKLMQSALQKKSVLVTGGGGSIGSELCRQLCHFRPEHLIVCDNSENNLYQIEIELRQMFPSLTIDPILADVRNRAQMDTIFRLHQPSVVIHAAAYKHVPMMELFPGEAIQNNVCGTLNMLVLAEQMGSDRFVLVSTDKAVRPHNVMGATKGVAELLTMAFGSRATQTRFMIVRFGNVVGSEGSVIPLFRKQIERGGPVTVTHPEMTRYFMTIPETAQLILQAGAMGEGGEIFVLDMGQPVKILDMARDLVRLSGLVPDEDIEIKIIGLRPGEKLHEELMAEGEQVLETANEKIMVIRGQVCPMDWLKSRIDELLECVDNSDPSALKRKLKEIIPQYTPYNGSSSPYLSPETPRRTEHGQRGTL